MTEFSAREYEAENRRYLEEEAAKVAPFVDGYSGMTVEAFLSKAFGAEDLGSSLKDCLTDIRIYCHLREYDFRRCIGAARFGTSYGEGENAVVSALERLCTFAEERGLDLDYVLWSSQNHFEAEIEIDDIHKDVLLGRLRAKKRKRKKEVINKKLAMIVVGLLPLWVGAGSVDIVIPQGRVERLGPGDGNEKSVVRVELERSYEIVTNSIAEYRDSPQLWSLTTNVVAIGSITYYYEKPDCSQQIAEAVKYPKVSAASLYVWSNDFITGSLDGFVLFSRTNRTRIASIEVTTTVTQMLSTNVQVEYRPDVTESNGFSSGSP